MRKVFAVIKREYLQVVRKKSFWIFSILMPVLLLGMMLGPALLMRRGLSGKSLQRRLSAVRSFYRWLNRSQTSELDPASGLRAPKSPRKLPQVLDADEMTRLVEVPTDTPMGLRDRAMLELFYSSGLRLSELCALRWRELALADGLVTVTGKGRKTRVVPVGSHARDALQAWREESKPAADAPVFPGRAGGPISPRTSFRRIRRTPASRSFRFRSIIRT